MNYLRTEDSWVVHRSVAVIFISLTYFVLILLVYLRYGVGRNAERKYFILPFIHKIEQMKKLLQRIIWSIVGRKYYFIIITAIDDTDQLSSLLYTSYREAKNAKTFILKHGVVVHDLSIHSFRIHKTLLPAEDKIHNLKH